MLLTFDTCLDKTYVGLADNDNVLSTKIIENNGNTYHSAYLISTIAEILKENHLSPQDLTAIATNIGPGSFTGIRACTSVARIMAQQLNLKAIGISSLELIAELNTNKDTKTLVLLDARKNMAYVWDEEILGSIAIEDINEMVKEDKYSIICDDSMYEVFKEITKDIQSYTKIPHDFAKTLIKIANKKLEKDFSDWRKLKPLYIQPPPIFGK